MRHRIVNTITGPGSNLVRTILMLRRGDGDATVMAGTKPKPPTHWASVKLLTFTDLKEKSK